MQAPELPPWIESQLPAGTRRRCVEAGGLRWHLMEWGPEDGRPVLLLHGNLTWSFLWRKVAAAVLDGEPLVTADRPDRSSRTPRPLRLIAPDLPGLGLTQRPPTSEHRLAQHGQWMGALLAALALDDVVFVGQDWGGAIGLLGLAERPTSLSGLVLLNTVVGPPRPGFRSKSFHRLARLPLASDALFRVAGFPLFSLHQAQGDPASIRGDVARTYRWPLRGSRTGPTPGLLWSPTPLALARMVPDSFEHESIPALERCQAFVQGFRGPAAIVWGESDPVLARVRPRIEALLPQAAVTLTTAGHFLQEEVPREIAAAIRSVRPS